MHAKLFLVIILMAVLSGCTYQKGDRYTSLLPGDSLTYLILAKGSGEKLAEKVSNLKFNHESRGNSCEVKYVRDSSSLIDQKTILLFHSSVPDMEEDILSKGFIGTFASRQEVIYLLISEQELIQHFRKTKE